MNTKYILIAVFLFLLGTIGLLSFKLVQSSRNYNRAFFQNRDLPRIGFEQRNNPELGQNQLSRSGNPSQSKQNCLADGCLAVDDLNYPVGKLTDEAKASLFKALDDEYKAQATYDAVINKFGNVRPFIMIIRGEEQHISSLKALFDKYGLDIPENSYIGTITSPNTLAEACALGVDAENANASLYKNDLLPNVKDYEDITIVFNNLMNASQQNHLPAFENCAQ